MNRLMSLAINSFKEIVRQPFYLVILFSGCFITLMSFSFTFFAFGEEARMIKNMGISTITICGLLTGCLSSSILIASEFERQTALAVLSKPITRTHFILGKYLGIMAATIVLIFFQGLVLEVGLAISKYLKISNLEFFDYQQQNKSLIDYHCLMGIYFSLLQISMLTAISVILAIYLNVTGNLIVCFLVFVFSHIFSNIFPFHYQYMNITSIPIAICYVIFPNLYNLNLATISDIEQGSIYTYIVYNSLYSLIYSTILIWLAIMLFKRKEIV